MAFDLATHRGYDSRPSARDRRRRQGRRGHRLRRGHEDPVRRHPARQDVGVDDHERRRAADPGRLHRRRRGAGRRARRSCRARSRTTSSRSSWSATPTSTRPRRACGSSPTSSGTPRSNMPKFNSISISGYHMQEAGATQALELAFTLADGLEYVRTAIARGPGRRRVRRPRLSFFWAIGMNFFMEIAKMRAARLLWARHHEPVRRQEPEVADAAHPLPDLGLVPDRAGPVQQRRAHHHRGDGRGVRRHADACTPTRFDEAIALPTEFSARIARNTQLIIQEETAHHQRGRPLGRLATSMETLTAATWPTRPGRIIEEVEALGRHDQGRRVGLGQAAASRSLRAPRSRRASTRGEDVIVGVNKYQLGRGRRRSTSSKSTTRAVREQQIARLEADPRQARRRRGADAALDGADRGRRARRRQPARALRSRRCALRATRRRDLRRAGEGLRPPPRRDPAASPASTAPRYDGDAELRTRSSTRSPTFADAPGPPPAHPGRQDGPGRPRPRRQGGRHRLRRPRLRRRRRARCSRRRRRSPARRSRTTCTSVGVSSLAAGHKTLVPAAHPGAPKPRAPTTSSSSSAASIPPQDYDFLTQAGVAGIFGPGTHDPRRAPASVLARDRHASHAA